MKGNGVLSVKPIGTVTMDFQFVEASTQSILSEMMENATDYSTYVEFLCQHVLVDQNPEDELVLLALRHAEYLGKNRLYSKILDKYRIRDVVFPYYLAKSVADKEEWKHILKEIKRVTDECEVDWVRFWYRILLYWLAHTRAIDEHLADKTADEIEKLVQRNDKLRCYLPQYYYLKARRLRYEGGIEQAIEICRLALEVSRDYEDRYFESRALKEIGALLGFFSFEPMAIEEARPFLREAREICEELGDTRGQIEVLSYVGGMCGTRGELSESKSINLEVISLRERIGDEPTYEFHNASAISAILGEGKEALEWAKTGLEQRGSKPLLLSYLHLDKAAAFIILNHLEEAEVQIDIARELNLKSGIESGLAYEYMVNGLLESAKGDSDSAFHSFESALEINERNARYNRMIMCLNMLAELEVATFEPTPMNRNHDVSGTWLERFDRLAREMNLPGYIGIALCLKSELRIKQGRHNEAQEFAEEILRMSKKPGMEFLRNEALQVHDALLPRRF